MYLPWADTVVHPLRQGFYPRAARVPGIHRLPRCRGVGDQETNIGRDYYSPTGHLARVYPHLNLQAGQCYQLALSTANLCSSLSRPLTGLFAGRGITNRRRHTNSTVLDITRAKRTHDKTGEKATESRIYRNLLQVCSNGVGRLRGFPQKCILAKARAGKTT